MIRAPLRRLLCLIAIVLVAVPAAAAEHRFGLGGHYWRTIDSIEDDDFDIDEDGVTPYLTYQYLPGGLLRFEIDLEYFDEGFGGSAEEAYAPIVFALVGGGLYGGVGVGVVVSDGFEDEISDPFYAARVGFDMELLPAIHLDINANYRANTFSELDEADTDSITLGAAVRAAF